MILYRNPRFWIIRNLMNKEIAWRYINGNRRFCTLILWCTLFNCCFCLKSCALLDHPMKPWMKSQMTHTKTTTNCTHRNHWTHWHNKSKERRNKKGRRIVIFMISFFRINCIVNLQILSNRLPLRFHPFTYRTTKKKLLNKNR